MGCGRVWFSGCAGFFVIVAWLGGIEARYRELKVGLFDEGNVGAGVEGLVVWCIPVSTIDNLQSRVVASRDLGWCIGNVNAAVAWIEICNAALLNQCVKVIVRGRIFTNMCISNDNKKLEGVS